MYDIIFISYDEKNADENFSLLKQRFARAKRVHGVKGIHEAHKLAAKKSFTKMFWVVDGDAVIVDEFNFDYVVPEDDLDYVHVWRGKNSVNDLEYGYGGVKLLPKKITMSMNNNNVDMTTSISARFKVMPEISNYTVFNTDALSAWRAGFRECAKLASSIIAHNNKNENLERLNVWCNIGKNKPYGEYVIAGSKEGRSYGEKNLGNQEALSYINDFDWLKRQFQQNFQLTETI